MDEPTRSSLQKAQGDEYFQCFLAKLFGKPTVVEHKGEKCRGFIWRQHVYFLYTSPFDTYSDDPGNIPGDFDDEDSDF